jgi:LysW-gamma-L-lysine carboxypeptidase
MDECISFLRDLVSIPSHTGETERSMEFLRDRILSFGMDAIVEEGVLIIGPEAEDLLLMGHIDTVTGTIPVRIENGELWGRGSVDAKGPLCASILALMKRPDLWKRVKIIAVPDEEGNSRSAKRIREEMEPTSTVILEPSQWNGITLAYQGRCLIELHSRTPPSHSGGKNDFATELVLSAVDRIVKDTNGRVLNINGDLREARALIDIRYTEKPRLDLQSDNVNMSILEDVPPVRTGKNNPLVRSFLRAIRSNNGSPVFKRKTGTSDMNHLAEKWDVDIVAYGPGDGSLDHTDEERISLMEFKKSIDVWVKFLEIYFEK